MNRYTVSWSPTAETQLATLWLDAIDREAFRLAADELDGLLAASAEDLGESREGNDRIFIGKLFAIEFEVNQSDRTVLVLTVWIPRYRAS